MEPNRKSPETTKSTPFSILSIPNVELAIRQLHNKTLSRRFNTQYVVENSPFSNDTLCFGDIFARRSNQNPRAEYFTWKIRTEDWFYTSETAAIFNEYFDWIQQHPAWVEDIKFEFKENQLYVTFPFEISKLKFHYLVFLLRRLEWHPYTVVSWYILNHLNLKFTEQQKLQLANFILFEDYKHRTPEGYSTYLFSMSEPDSSHYLCSALQSTGLYTRDIPDPATLFDIKQKYGGCQTYASSIWFGAGTLNKIVEAQMYKKLGNSNGRIYENLSRDW